jgi:hypothetical protein
MLLEVETKTTAEKSAGIEFDNTLKLITYLRLD